MNIYSKKSTIEKDNGAPEGRVFSFEVFLSQQKIQMTRYFIAVSVLYSSEKRAHLKMLSIIRLFSSFLILQTIQIYITVSPSLLVPL